MGTLAGRILIDRLQGDVSEHRVHSLPTTLVLRGSERLG